MTGERAHEIKNEMEWLIAKKREINIRLQALQVEVADYQKSQVIESAKAKRRKRCLVLELHVCGMKQTNVSKFTGIPYHSLQGYLCQSESDYSYALKMWRADGEGRLTFWRKHKLDMILINLRCAHVAMQLGGKLEDVKDCDDEYWFRENT